MARISGREHTADLSGVKRVTRLENHGASVISAVSRERRVSGTRTPVPTPRQVVTHSIGSLPIVDIALQHGIGNRCCGTGKEQRVGHRLHRGTRSDTTGVARRRCDGTAGRELDRWEGRRAVIPADRRPGGCDDNNKKKRIDGHDLANRPISRRRTLASAAAATICGALGAGMPARAATLAEPSAPFTVSWLHQRVRELAASPFEPLKVICRRR